MTPTLEERIVLKHRRGRKQVHLVMPYPTGREAMWIAMRQLKTFTMSQLEHTTRIGVETLRCYVVGLTKAGYLERKAQAKIPGKGSYEPSTWTVIRDVGVDAPRITRSGKLMAPTARERMWSTLRILKECSIEELVAAASEGSTPIDRNDAGDYLKHLTLAGYTRVTLKGAPYRGARYKLIPVRDSGPQAPMVQRIKQVYDPNLRRVVWPVQRS